MYTKKDCCLYKGFQFGAKKNKLRNTNLETQADRLVGFCIANGWIVDSVVKEVGSGLNDERKNLTKILKDPSVKRIVVLCSKRRIQKIKEILLEDENNNAESQPS